MNSPLRIIAVARLLVLALACSVVSLGASASVVIVGTRVVYPADARDVSVRLTNTGSSPSLVQAWIDSGDPTASPESIKVPFVLTPPLSRIDPNRNQTLRLVFTGQGLPQDKESLFWLNVLEVPPKPTGDANFLQFAVRSRVKVFYRPASLAKGGAAEAHGAIEWSGVTQQPNGDCLVRARNASPYYVSMTQVRLAAAGQEVGTPLNVMLAPGQVESIAFPAVKAPVSAITAVRYQVIDDYGALLDGERAITPSR